MSLHDKAILIDATLRQWNARKADKAVSGEVNAQKGAAADASKVIKRLISKEMTDPISQNITALRQFYYLRTLPWLNGGFRILPSNQLMSFREGWKELEGQAQGKIDELILNYDVAMDRAELDLGKLFNASDYPSSDELRSKFEITLDIMPVPYTKDFRADASDEEIKELKTRIQETETKAMQRCAEEPYKRIQKLVEEMSLALGHDANTTQGRIFKSKLDNLEKCINATPSINAFQDQNLTDVSESARALLLDADVLRSNSAARRVTKTTADDILRKMSGFMGQPPATI
tara:strand:- start:1895 stop:2764 length:870 start_codon:yes stop_codon:yes gene_type:complete